MLRFPSILSMLKLGMAVRVATSSEQSSCGNDTADGAKSCRVVDHGRALTDWVHHRGGYVSEKLEIRRLEPSNSESPYGVFATVDIEEDEDLLAIPRNCYLGIPAEDVVVEEFPFHFNWTTTGDMAYTDQMMEGYRVYYANTCKLAHRLLEEMELYRTDPKSSNYGPYLAYLETQAMGQLPATYSDSGKKLLRKIQGKSPHPSPNYGAHQLPPWRLVDWIDEEFVRTGCINANDKKAEHAVAMSIQRGYDRDLIPIWDMVNHNNEKLNVDTNSLYSPEGLEVWADDPIKAGSEVYATYNYCTDCSDVGDDWGTPGIFRDFGFVEDYPQVWPLLDHDVYFELEKDEETGRFQAIYSKHEETGEFVNVPNETGIAFMREQLSRLKGMDLQEEEEKLGSIPRHQWDMIEQYYNALIIALGAGIDAALPLMRPEDQQREEHKEF